MTEFQKRYLLFCSELHISVIRICFEFRLPARSRFGEGRDFVLRIYDLTKGVIHVRKTVIIKR
jgi:hypothetical protein